MCLLRRPNARRELRLEAGARDERTLEAVSSTPLFGQGGCRVRPLPRRCGALDPPRRAQERYSPLGRRHSLGVQTELVALRIGEDHPMIPSLRVALQFACTQAEECRPIRVEI